jgi:hypothetical protein
VDEVITEGVLGQRRFVGPKATDTVMTTWHDSEGLGEALDFLHLTLLTQLAVLRTANIGGVCLNNSEWTETVRRILGTAELRG